MLSRARRGVCEIVAGAALWRCRCEIVAGAALWRCRCRSRGRRSILCIWVCVCVAGVALGSCLEGQDVVARGGGCAKSWQAQHFGDAVAKSWQAQHFGDAVAEVVAGAAFCASGCSVIASIQGAHGTCVWTFGKNIACGVIRSFNIFGLGHQPREQVARLVAAASRNGLFPDVQ